MNLIVVILVVIIIWLVYALLQSYRGLAEELRQIRAQCIGTGTGTAGQGYKASTVDPVDKMTGSLISGLKVIKQYAAQTA